MSGREAFKKITAENCRARGDFYEKVGSESVVFHIVERCRIHCAVGCTSNGHLVCIMYDRNRKSNKYAHICGTAERAIIPSVLRN